MTNESMIFENTLKFIIQKYTFVTATNDVLTNFENLYAIVLDCTHFCKQRAKRFVN